MIFRWALSGDVESELSVTGQFEADDIERLYEFLRLARVALEKAAEARRLHIEREFGPAALAARRAERQELDA